MLVVDYLCCRVLSPVLGDNVEQLAVALCAVVDDLLASESMATTHTALGERDSQSAFLCTSMSL